MAICVLIIFFIFVVMVVTMYRHHQHNLKSKDFHHVGRAGWSLLHQTAVQFPLQPSSQETSDMMQWIRLFGILFPCEDCRYHLNRYIETHPINASSREAIIFWCWRLHNDVNKRLHKPLFPLSHYLKEWTLDEHRCKNCMT